MLPSKAFETLVPLMKHICMLLVHIIPDVCTFFKSQFLLQIFFVKINLKKPAKVLNKDLN